MKIIFLTFSPLHMESGHIARLSLVLEYVAHYNDVTIACLRKGEESWETRARLKRVSCLSIPADFEGWRVKNAADVAMNILSLVNKTCPDLVVLTMEVWDLMREIGYHLKGIVKFATIVHAMPFLGAPINPSDNFEYDIKKYVQTEIEDYKKNYILDHYKETQSVLKNISIIANNKTVAFYFKKYFKDMHIYELTAFITAKIINGITVSIKPFYDFVYMARMESGKGIEYLPEILRRISSLLNRKIKVAILGRTEDDLSKRALDEIMTESEKGRYFVAKYFGWADTDLKKEILTNSGVFLYPSHYDNYPTVLNEALAFGLPCVVWDVPFARLNYSKTDAVKQVPLLNFQQFAEDAVTVFHSRGELSRQALEFVSDFISPATAAQLDTDIFREISNKIK